jgi:hypothetical protein
MVAMAAPATSTLGKKNKPLINKAFIMTFTKLALKLQTI